ncbi:MAG TPA: redoxin domain-containing protein [Planctomycetota bacterium]|nr:redoxin domain-containing protein [Planctomycetota bacterium]
MCTLALLFLAAVPLAAGPDGDAAPDFTLADLSGKTVTLSSLKGKKAVVLVFAGIECPRSTAAEARLGDLAKKFDSPGVAFYVINSNWSETVEAITERVKKIGFPLPVLKDPQNKVADLFKIDVQPTAVVLDGDLRIRYRGLIDDHKNEELVKHAYLREALEAVLAGRNPETTETKSVGCAIQKLAPQGASGTVTYSKDVARILNRNCVTCHRQGQVAPFSLETYEKAKAWSQEIMNTTRQRSMPPWKPVTNHGFYYNERVLSDDDLAVLAQWHQGGAPEGDPKETPEPPKFPDAWMLGKPDAVLKAEGGYELPAKGRDEYRCYVIRNPFDEDKWVTGIEYRPGNLRAVHHIIGYLDMSGLSEKKDAADPLPGYRSDGSGPGILPSGSLAGWAPGNQPRQLPEGTARLLRKGERLVLETHYHKTGRKEVDEGAQVALYFAKEPVKRQLHVHMIINPLVNIPAGAEDYRLTGLWTVPQNVHALDVMPHMHLIGRTMSVVATFPDGSTKDLVVIKDWDFNWQETYQFKEPIELPRGTKVRLEAHYDNSANNPNNPSNPPRTVRWGEQTTDEMCIAFVAFTIDRQDLTKPKPPEDK